LILRRGVEQFGSSLGS